MNKKSIPLSEVYRYLEPGPVVLVTTARDGKANVMTMSWLTMIDFEPPIVGCVMSDRNFSFKILQETHECVINIPTVELADRVVKIGNTSGSKVNKFEKFHLLTEPAKTVKAPLLSECYVNLECNVIDTTLTRRYDLFILEVKKAWKRPTRARARTIHHCGKGIFVVDGEIIKITSKKK